MGLRTCDSWDQIAGRTRMGDGSNRRIIDCRGFSFIAARPAGRGGLGGQGVPDVLRAGRRDIPWHVAVEVHWTKTQGMNDMLVGTQEASDGGCLQEKTRGYVNHSEVIGSVIVTDPPRATQAQAFQAALDKDPQPGDPRLAVVGTFPARQSCRVVPAPLRAWIEVGVANAGRPWRHVCDGVRIERW